MACSEDVLDDKNIYGFKQVHHGWYRGHVWAISFRYLTFVWFKPLHTILYPLLQASIYRCRISSPLQFRPFCTEGSHLQTVGGWLDNRWNDR